MQKYHGTQYIQRKKVSAAGGRVREDPGKNKNIPVRAAKAGQGCFWYFLAQSDSSGRGAKSERFFRAY